MERSLAGFINDLLHLASAGIPVRSYLDGSMAESNLPTKKPARKAVASSSKPKRKKREPSGFGKVKVP